MAHRSYDIQVEFLGGLTQSQQAIFNDAATRWSQVITADVRPVRVFGRRIDDLLIFAKGSHIDGPSGILGQAGPWHLRPGSLLPATGMMEFDISDLARMEDDGSLLAVIVHEMGHVIGLGTLWGRMGLVQGSGTANPVFVGQNAMQEFAALIDAPEATPVPLANTGGEGTREGHWRESVFGSELMTGFLNIGPNPLSRLTIGALEDQGYRISFKTAEDYALPAPLLIAMMGIGAHESSQCCCMCGRRARGPAAVELSEETYMA